MALGQQQQHMMESMGKECDEMTITGRQQHYADEVEEEKEEYNDDMRTLRMQQGEAKESEEKESRSHRREKHTSFKIDSKRRDRGIARDSGSRHGNRSRHGDRDGGGGSSRHGNRSSRSRQSRSRHGQKDSESGSRHGNRHEYQDKSYHESKIFPTRKISGNGLLGMTLGSEDNMGMSEGKIFPPIRTTTPDASLGRSIAGLQLQKALS